MQPYVTTDRPRIAMKKAPRQKRSRKLVTYRRKRDFSRTPEPRGRGRRRANACNTSCKSTTRRACTTTFRLEHDGVLKSWAVPKEPSVNPKDRRLAVQVEDHPLDYGGFEGEIPKGEYGAGSVVIWDQGHWLPLGDAEQGLKDGKLDFELARPTAQGALDARAHGGAQQAQARQGELAADEAQRSRARRRPRARLPRTSASAARAPDSEQIPGARRGDAAEAPSPQLATLVTRTARRRRLALRAEARRLSRAVPNRGRRRATLLTRRGNDWTERFGAIAQAAQRLPCRAALLDGEAVVFDARGLTSFQRLQNALDGQRHARSCSSHSICCISTAGTCTASRCASARRCSRACSRTRRRSDPLRRARRRRRREVSRKQACKLGLEGVVAKRAADPYREERTRSWLKVKCLQRQEFVIVGFTDPGGSRTGFGALLSAMRDEPGRAVALCRQGRHGLRRALAQDAADTTRAARTLARRRSSRRRRAASARGVHWVEPKLVAEIAYTEWTSDGRLRHPVFRRVARGQAGRRDRRGAAASPSPRRSVARDEARVKLTNPDKVLFPDPGITKRQLADYWVAVADVALPLLAHARSRCIAAPRATRSSASIRSISASASRTAVPRVAIHGRRGSVRDARRRSLRCSRSRRSACSSCTSGARAPSISISPTSSSSISIRPQTCRGAKSQARA